MSNKVKITFEILLVIVCMVQLWVVTKSSGGTLVITSFGLMYSLYVLITIMKKNRGGR